MRWIVDRIYEAVGLWHLWEPHTSYSIVLISMITQTRKHIVYLLYFTFYIFVGTEGCSILGTSVIF